MSEIKDNGIGRGLNINLVKDNKGVLDYILGALVIDILDYDLDLTEELSIILKPTPDAMIYNNTISVILFELKTKEITHRDVYDVIWHRSYFTYSVLNSKKVSRRKASIEAVKQTKDVYNDIMKYKNS